jgi:hypothetical protein
MYIQFDFAGSTTCTGTLAGDAGVAGVTGVAGVAGVTNPLSM